MITTLTGNNGFQIQAELQRLTRTFTSEHGDLALEKLDGEEDDYARIVGAVESLPFLASKKMVVVHGLSANKDAVESLDRLMELAGETTDLIIIEPKPDKRSSLYKQLKSSTDFHEYNEPDENQLTQWLIKSAEEKGASLSRADAAYLIARVGSVQMRLDKELAKLVDYNPAITRTTINMLTDENPSSTIFNLVDGIFSGNVKNALRIYDEQRKLKVEPQAIHGMLVWQMHVVSVVSAAPQGATSAQIAKDAGMSPYVVQKSQRIAAKMGRAKIIECMKLLRDIDHRSKRETIDYDEALRFAILSLAD